MTPTDRDQNETRSDADSEAGVVEQVGPAAPSALAPSEADTEEAGGIAPPPASSSSAGDGDDVELELDLDDAAGRHPSSAGFGVVGKFTGAREDRDAQEAGYHHRWQDAREDAGEPRTTEAGHND